MTAFNIVFGALNVATTLYLVRRIQRANFRAAQYDKLMRDWWEKNPTAISQEPTWTCEGPSFGRHAPFQIPKGQPCGVCKQEEALV